MNWQNRWVVLAPGDPVLLENRARQILEEFDEGNTYTFAIFAGNGRYQSIVETGDRQTELDVVLGDAFSRELDGVVYAIEGRETDPDILSFLRGAKTHVDQEPEELVRALGCTVPWFDEPPPPPLTRRMRTVALIQGVGMAKIRKALERIAGRSLPPAYHHLEETPQGVLLADGTGPLVGEQIELVERFPRATVYSVKATPTLDSFSVIVMQGNHTWEFVPPQGEALTFPAVHEIMGERTPEAILAAMGIPKEWFKL